MIPQGINLINLYKNNVVSGFYRRGGRKINKTFIYITKVWLLSGGYL